MAIGGNCFVGIKINTLILKSYDKVKKKFKDDKKLLEISQKYQEICPQYFCA